MPFPLPKVLNFFKQVENLRAQMTFPGSSNPIKYEINNGQWGKKADLEPNDAHRPEQFLQDGSAMINPASVSEFLPLKARVRLSELDAGGREGKWSPFRLVSFL